MAVEPCLRLETGAVTATGVNVVPVRQDTHPWLSVGAVGRAEWTLREPFFVGIEAGFRAPLSRPTYFFRPDTVYYRAPSVGAVVGFGIGAHFL
jgi:hypothetical protein